MLTVGRKCNDGELASSCSSCSTDLQVMQVSSRPAFTIRSKGSTTELSLRREASFLRTPERTATPPQCDAQDSDRWPPRGSSCAYSQPRLEQPRWIDHVPISPCRLVAAPAGQPLTQIDTGCLDAWGVETTPDKWGVSPSRMPLRPSCASTLASAPPPASSASLPTPASALAPRPLPTDSASTGPMFPGYPAPKPHPASTTPLSATFLAFSPRSIGEEIVRRLPQCVTTLASRSGFP